MLEEFVYVLCVTKLGKIFLKYFWIIWENFEKELSVNLKIFKLIYYLTEISENFKKIYNNFYLRVDSKNL